MKTILFILLVGVTVAFAGEKELKPLDAIKSHGSITLTDGSSYFTFEKDGKFESGPMRMGGRSIQGKWSYDGDSKFTIIGEWSWVNGESIPNDRRQMILDIRSGTFKKSPKQILWQKDQEIFECYWYIDELKAVLSVVK